MSRHLVVFFCALLVGVARGEPVENLRQAAFDRAQARVQAELDAYRTASPTDKSEIAASWLLLVDSEREATSDRAYETAVFLDTLLRSPDPATKKLARAKYDSALWIFRSKLSAEFWQSPIDARVGKRLAAIDAHRTRNGYDDLRATILEEVTSPMVMPSKSNPLSFAEQRYERALILRHFLSSRERQAVAPVDEKLERQAELVRRAREDVPEAIRTLTDLGPAERALMQPYLLDIAERLVREASPQEAATLFQALAEGAGYHTSWRNSYATIIAEQIAALKKTQGTAGAQTAYQRALALRMANARAFLPALKQAIELTPEGVRTQAMAHLGAGLPCLLPMYQTAGN